MIILSQTVLYACADNCIEKAIASDDICGHIR